MGDRNNPIKFGPAWMRNFGQISSSGSAGNQNNQNPTNSRANPAPRGSVTPTRSRSGPTYTQGYSGEGTAQGSANSNTILTGNSGGSGNNDLIMAEMRYGREEMLALYERTTDAPEQLKYFDQLYQQRRKPPVALNNSFQEEMQRENTRGAKPANTSRSLNRVSPNENRRTRTPFPRNASSGKGILWNMAQKNTRPPNYHSSYEVNTNVPWGGNNGNTLQAPPPPPPPRPHIEQHERSGSKVYRRRVNNNTNWRQHSREEDEWRSRNRPNAERDWGERPVQGKQSSWNANRSGWVGGEGNNEESLPEWAVESAVGKTGTFDSTGAFHGYSNDDTNLPKTADTSFPLVRSLTHGSLTHSKNSANGFEEWWASDKAKKLSPNKLETSDVKLKQASNVQPSEDKSGTPDKENGKEAESKIDVAESDTAEKSEATSTTPKPEETDKFSDDLKDANLKTKFVESKTFDDLMRSDINLEKVTDDIGKFQSVLISTNNSLRQKHKNMVATNENTQRQPRMPVLQRLHSTTNEEAAAANSTSKNLVGEMFNLTIDDSKESTSNVTPINANTSINQTDRQLLTPMPKSSIPVSSPRISIGGMQAVVMQAGAMQAGAMQAGAIQTGVMQAGVMQAGVMQVSGMQGGGMQPGAMHASGMQPGGMQPSGMLPSGMQHGGMQLGAMHPGGMLPTSMQPGGMQPGGMHPGSMPPAGMLPGGMQPGAMQPGAMQPGAMQPGAMQPGGMQASGMQTGGMHVRDLHSSVGGRGGFESVGGIHFTGIHPSQLHANAQVIQQSLLQQAGIQGGMQPGELQPNMLQSGRDGGASMQAARMGSSIQNIGVPNQALNAAMGLPTSGNGGQIIPMPGVSRPMMENSAVMGFGAADMHPNSSMMSAYHPQSGLSIMSGSNIHNNSMFLGQNNNSMQPTNEMAAQQARPDMYQGQQQAPYGSMYMMPSNNAQAAQNNVNLLDQWYYEDPQYNIHGPFSSKDMYNWYKAGFFNPNLMIRRACDANMRRLGSYGPMAFGAPIDLLNPYQGNPPGYVRRDPRDLVNQKGLALEESLWRQSAQSPEMVWMPQAAEASNESRVNNLPIQFWDTEPSALTSKSLLPEKIDKEVKPDDQTAAELKAPQNINTCQTLPIVSMQSSVSTTSSDSQPESCSHTLERMIPNLEEVQKILKEKWLVTIEPTPIICTEDKVEPSLSSKSLLAENVDNEVKSEDAVPVQIVPLVNKQSSVSTTSSDSQSDVYPPIHERTTPNLEEIQNLLQIKWLVTVAPTPGTRSVENEEQEVTADQISKEEQSNADTSNAKQDQQNTSKTSIETKPVKNTKTENEKTVKGKNTKSKNKKTKVGKKEDAVEVKTKEDAVKTEVRKGDETTTPKSKKEEKQNKKDAEKDGKDLHLKDGFTIKEEVKGSDKGIAKDSKKKENAKGFDNADSNRKEVAAEEKKGKKNIEKTTNDKKQQLQGEMQPSVESLQLRKKIPWLDAATAQARANYGMTVSNIQRLEREKKMEEIKIQQRMIQIIASQHADSLAMEKIMQARLHWAKQSRPCSNADPQIADIQAEARLQAAMQSSAASLAMARPFENPETLLPPIPNTPWATCDSTIPPAAPIGFWDARPKKDDKLDEKPQDLQLQKAEEASTSIKKKPVTPISSLEKEISAAVLEFDSWCKNVLMTWDKTIDVSTFVSFLKDIESPYDVKDYVKFYLGESKDANDFARHFLEKRSKLLRVGTVTPSDDLCSPAMAINPRMSLNSGYQDAKGKGKKSKKNKMLKVDSRILGFSVTASEDRINVGDIDTA